jgi:hypothetical protein
MFLAVLKNPIGAFQQAAIQKREKAGSEIPLPASPCLTANAAGGRLFV